MLILSKNIKRTLERIEKTIQKDIKEGAEYPASFAVNQIVYTGKEAVERQLTIFQAFKRSLENGTNQVVNCYDDEREESMLDLIGMIWKFYDPFTGSQIANIDNEAVIEKGIRQRLEKFRERFCKDKVAADLEKFLKNPCSSSWGTDDKHCGFRIFKLVLTSEEFKHIVKRKGISEITANQPKEGCNIHIAFERIEECQVIKKKGLQHDYKRFLYKFANHENLDIKIEKYKFWYGIKERGIYYVYIPDIR